MKGLIIKQTWLDLILEGGKTWEMRSSNTSVRGRIALIEAGTGTVKGVAELVRTKGPCSDEEMLDHEHMHKIPSADISKPEMSKWRMAWVLQDAIAVSKPIPYRHPNGAVTWVNLAPDVVTQINRGLTSTDYINELVPVARDGSWFGPHLARSGKTYTVGAKGEEQQVQGFIRALTEIQKMPVARWRRPNANGNWGIVRAVNEWKKLGDLISE